jgi:hypothetical protein
MRPAASLSSVALALSIGLFSFAITALAGPKEDVGAAAMAWAQALGENDPEKVLPFYAEDAVLWRTLSPNVRSDRAALRDYFVTAFKVLPSLRVTFGNQLIRVYAMRRSIPATTRFPM